MKNNLKFQGIVKNIQSETIGKEKTYLKTSFLIEENETQYPNSAIFELFDKQEMINNIKENDTILITFNMKAKEYNGKYYGSNSIFKIEKIAKEEEEENKSISESREKDIFKENTSTSDLPF